MDGLSDELVVRILSSHLALHDLLHMSRVSRRFRDLIQAAETLWESSAEGCSFDAGLKNDDQTWRHFFKVRRGLCTAHLPPP